MPVLRRQSGTVKLEETQSPKDLYSGLYSAIDWLCNLKEGTLVLWIITAAAMHSLPAMYGRLGCVLYLFFLF